jgi:hypothetical protein
MEDYVGWREEEAVQRLISHGKVARGLTARGQLAAGGGDGFDWRVGVKSAGPRGLVDRGAEWAEILLSG